MLKTDRSEILAEDLNMVLIGREQPVYMLFGAPLRRSLPSLVRPVWGSESFNYYLGTSPQGVQAHLSQSG